MSDEHGIEIPKHGRERPRADANRRVSVPFVSGPFSVRLRG
jgi:hypothetical protein